MLPSNIPNPLENQSYSSGGSSSSNIPVHVPSSSKYPEVWDNTPMPGPFLQLQMQAAHSPIARSRTLSPPSIHPNISNLINTGATDSAATRSQPASCPPKLNTTSPDHIVPLPAPFGEQPPRPRPRARMRPVPHTPSLSQGLHLADGPASPFRDPSHWFQLPATPVAYPTRAQPHSSPAWSLSSPAYPAADCMHRLPPPNSPSPASNIAVGNLGPRHPVSSGSDEPPLLPRVGLPYVRPGLAPHVALPAAPLVNPLAVPRVPVAEPAEPVPVPPANPPAVPHIPIAEPAEPAPVPAGAPSVKPTGLGGKQADREGTPSTIVISDTDSALPSPNKLFRREGANGSRALRRSDAMTEPEMLRELSAKRKWRTWQPWEDLRLVRYLLDPEHEDRMAQAQQKLKKGCVPKVLEQASREAFLGSRAPKSVHERWGTIKKTFAVVHWLETATGGNGDADYVNDDPNQTVLEKLGRRLTSASKRMNIENLKASEYLAWVEDPVNGLYALLADFLSSDVPVVRQRQFRSGALSPVRSTPTLDADHDGDSVVVLDGDDAVSMPASRAGSTPPAPASQDSRQRNRKPKAEDSEFTAASGLAFIRETQSYHAARAETDRRRLELETDRFKLEQGNEARAEKRMQHEQERLELMRSEQAHMVTIARDSHDLELARLDLTRERNQDLKRKAELDELDRLRTHKRLRAETTTNMALQIQADKDDRFSEKLKEASQNHILAMFAQARELD